MYAFQKAPNVMSDVIQRMVCDLSSIVYNILDNSETTNILQ